MSTSERVREDEFVPARACLWQIYTCSSELAQDYAFAPHSPAPVRGTPPICVLKAFPIYITTRENVSVHKVARLHGNVHLHTHFCTLFALRMREIHTANFDGCRELQQDGLAEEDVARFEAQLLDLFFLEIGLLAWARASDCVSQSTKMEGVFTCASV